MSIALAYTSFFAATSTARADEGSEHGLYRLNGRNLLVAISARTEDFAFVVPIGPQSPRRLPRPRWVDADAVIEAVPTEKLAKFHQALVAVHFETVGSEPQFAWIEDVSDVDPPRPRWVTVEALDYAVE